MHSSTLCTPDAREDRRHHELAAQLAGLSIEDFSPAAHHNVVLRGMRFHYLDWGRAGRPPALFLHGGGQTARTWDLSCLSLRQELHCIALDQRGHGDSEWSYSFEYSPEAHARDVAGLLDHLQVERVVLVGMSMGCLNALHFAARWPDRVASLVAVDAGPWVQLGGGQRIIDFMASTDGLESIEAWIDRALAFNPRRDRRLLRHSLLHNLRQLSDGRLSWKTDRRRPPDLSAMAQRLEALRERISEIRCPTLIVRGTESEVFLDEDAERFADALEGARIVRIEGAGHTVQGDNPKAFVGEIRKFAALEYGHAEE